MLCDQNTHVKRHDRIFRVKKETPRPIVAQILRNFRYSLADLTAAFPSRQNNCAFKIANQGQLFQRKVIV
jgi:hypothetical protein